MSSYPITAPVKFENVNAGDVLDFTANGPTIGTGNRVSNFVVTSSGDMIYRASGGSNYLERLPIGTNGQVLTVSSNLPSWQAATIGNINRTFNASATVTGGTKIDPGTTWVTLTNSIVTWDDSTNGNNDSGNMFNTTTGVFTVPEAGIYELSGAATFEANNTGPLIGTIIPNRRAIRQVRIFNTTTSKEMNFSERQTEASATNPTSIRLPSTRMSLSLSDTIVIQARHDANVSLNILGDTVDISTFFSACKIA